MKTLTELRAAFWEYLNEVAPELAAKKRSRKKQNEYCTDIRVSFVDFVDNQRREGNITEGLANRATL
jgi:hypothetical protein